MQTISEASDLARQNAALPREQNQNSDADDDADSTLGNEHRLSTQTLPDAFSQSVERNGRTYHSYRPGKYLLPDDAEEQYRQEFLHWYLRGKLPLVLAPIKNIHRVLDLGTGIGQWVIDFAEQHPEAHVIGTDLSCIQPKRVPPNVEFQIADAEEWSFTTPFNLIHWRLLYACFRDPERIIKNASHSLSPGGYMEMQDISFPPKLDVDNRAWEKFMQYIISGGKELGLDFQCVKNYQKHMEDAGLEDVYLSSYSFPIEHFFEEFNLLASSIQQRLCLSMVDFEALMYHVTGEAYDGKISGQVEILVTGGRKPGKFI